MCICFYVHKYHKKHAVCLVCDWNILAFVNTTDLELWVYVVIHLVSIYYCNENSFWVCECSIPCVTSKFRIKSVVWRKTTPGLNHWTQSAHRYTKIDFLKSLQENIFEIRFTEYNGIRQRNIFDKRLYVYLGSTQPLTEMSTGIISWG